MVPPYYMENIICPRCHKPAYKNRITKGVCFNCYRKFEWKQKLIACKRCGRMLPNQAKGFCSGCYNSLFHIEKVKSYVYSKYHNISYKLYLKLTEKCAICNFDKVIELHHLDKNHKNILEDNLAGLCPNHHRMLHSREFQDEILEALRDKGFKIPDVFYKKDEFYIIQQEITET